MDRKPAGEGITGPTGDDAGVTRHYFDQHPGGPSKPREVELVLPDVELRLVTDRGVFSTDRVDPGTLVLLRHIPHPAAPSGGRLVDLGSGYGPIAVTLARRRPDADVWAVDPNDRARRLCSTNAEAAGCDNVSVVPPEDYPDDRPIDELYSNPPIRIGKRALHDLLAVWLGRLAPGGVAWLVVQKHLGSDSLAAWLNEQGWATHRAVSRQAYRVLQVRPRQVEGLHQATSGT